MLEISRPLIAKHLKCYKQCSYCMNIVVCSHFFSVASNKKYCLKINSKLLIHLAGYAKVNYLL